MPEELKDGRKAETVMPPGMMEMLEKIVPMVLSSNENMQSERIRGRGITQDPRNSQRSPGLAGLYELNPHMLTETREQSNRRSYGAPPNVADWAPSGAGPEHMNQFVRDWEGQQTQKAMDGLRSPQEAQMYQSQERVSALQRLINDPTTDDDTYKMAQQQMGELIQNTPSHLLQQMLGEFTPDNLEQTPDINSITGEPMTVPNRTMGPLGYRDNTPYGQGGSGYYESAAPQGQTGNAAPQGQTEVPSESSSQAGGRWNMLNGVDDAPAPTSQAMIPFAPPSASVQQDSARGLVQRPSEQFAGQPIFDALQNLIDQGSHGTLFENFDESMPGRSIPTQRGPQIQGRDILSGLMEFLTQDSMTVNNKPYGQK